MTTMESEGNALCVEFPNFSGSLLQKLNQQRQRGQLCDIVVVIQGHQYRAHRAVLAASSPYFCDQVLLKNSVRVVLPDVMHACVFERLLNSCYTGTLLLPAGEVVAFLTAASFLQMWHVVDKCTELLEVGGSSSSLAFKSGAGQGASVCVIGTEDRPSPGDSSYHSPGDNSMGLEPNGQAVDGFAKMEMDQLLEGSFSPPALEPSVQPSGSCSPPAEPECSGSEVVSQNGEDEERGDGASQYARPTYVPPSIMGHRKWVHVKAERPEREDCGGLFCGDAVGTDPEKFNFGRSQPSASSLDNSIDEKLVAQLEEEEGLDDDRPYEDPLDFYGTTMGFSTNKADGTSLDLKEDALEVGAGNSGGGEQTSGSHQEDASHSGFASVVYKLYPCQCGKSFTHKSQRDRHMSMHLGLRPYGCAVCGKSFKMKHHLVGHMKIHTGIKPYECSLCSKRFMWRDSFNRHTSSCTRTHQARGAVNDQPPAQMC
ncbi:zinc finger and BTB domain-containing protein 43 [Hypomesus transpacificus]|uniref:zinc finger and BTB domain-containing protein 43 n=1 Tax=Hypomesus transpacificus TaxID=137520 RepID=UPI001F078319|nr:zinc finger and BTB domain-containing protein 43 [Hypomesus transpacificus]